MIDSAALSSEKEKGKGREVVHCSSEKMGLQRKKKKTLGIAFDRFARSRDLLLCRKWSDISPRDATSKQSILKKKRKM